MKHKINSNFSFTLDKKIWATITQNHSTEKTQGRQDHFMYMKILPPQKLVRALMPSLRQECVGNILSTYIFKKPLPMLPRVQSQMMASPAA